MWLITDSAVQRLHLITAFCDIKLEICQGLLQYIKWVLYLVKHSILQKADLLSYIGLQCLHCLGHCMHSMTACLDWPCEPSYSTLCLRPNLFSHLWPDGLIQALHRQLAEKDYSCHCPNLWKLRLYIIIFFDYTLIYRSNLNKQT